MQVDVKNDERVPERMSWEQLKTEVEKLLLDSINNIVKKNMNAQCP